MKDFFQSRAFKGTLAGVGVLIFALVMFQAGVSVGYHKATFSFRAGEDFYQTFGPRMPRSTIGTPFAGDDFAHPHGATGKIISVSLPTFVLEGLDNAEKHIVIGESTIIRHLRDALRPEDLKMGDNVIIIGEPNDHGQVSARLIRVLSGAQTPKSALPSSPKR